MNRKASNYIFKGSCDIVEPLCKIALSQTSIKAYSETICASVKGVCYVVADLIYPTNEDNNNVAGNDLAAHNADIV
jgi:hypothetical protein